MVKQKHWKAALWDFYSKIFFPMACIIIWVLLWAIGAGYLLMIYRTSLLIFVFIHGFKVIPPAHRGLLVIMGYRTKMAVSEGPKWLPPFITRFAVVDCREESFDIPAEDCWTSDQVHLVYDLVVQFAVKRLEPAKSFTDKLKRFFSWQNGDDIYKFTEVDPAAIMTALRGAALNTARKEIKKRTHMQILGFSGDDKVAITPEAEEQLTAAIKESLEAEAARFGLAIHNIYMRDLDLHKDMEEWMQQKVRQRLEKEADQVAYEILLQIGKKVSEASEGKLTTAESTLKLQIIDILKRAADQGILPALFQALLAGKVEELVQPAKVISKI